MTESKATDKEREAFEAWAKTKKLLLERSGVWPDRYSYCQTDDAWDGWRAALSSRDEATTDAVLTDAYADGRRDEQQELASVLPGVLYMDPPDGGAPTILDQLQRQAKDAARYVWLRAGNYPIAFARCVLNDTPHGIDSSIDAAIASQRTSTEGKVCGKCGQTDQGQTGEYHCPECGLPALWDEEPASNTEGKTP